MVGLEAPGVERDGDVVDQRVVAGEVEVDHARQRVAEEEHVVGEHVGVDDALRQVGRPVRLLVGKLLLDDGGKARRDLVGAGAEALEQRPPAGHRECIGAAQLEVGRGQMHARHHLADGRAVAHLRPAHPQALEEGDERGRPAGQRAQRLAARRRAPASGR